MADGSKSTYDCETTADSGSALSTPGTLIHERTVCVPVQCRGMNLLGFGFGNFIFVCVHQLSVELWKRYDTPRVSVQKKIQDLGIPVVNCDKEQIRALRRAGIIENFRATMVTLQDAERLYTALEYSRKKRGLVKHALKSAPTERFLRKEEVRAKRLSLKVNQKLWKDGCQRRHFVHPLRSVVPQRQGALNGVEALPEEGGSTAVEGARDEDCPEERLLLYSHIYPSSTSETFAKLLVADDAYVLDSAAEAGLRDYELLIETVPNQSFVKPSSFLAPQRMEHSFNFPDSMQESLDSVTGYQYARQLQGDSHTLDSSKLLTTATPPLSLPLSRLSSPGLCSSSELEDQFSLHSNTSSRSQSATVTSTPDRFLFLDSDTDIECEVSSNSNHNNCSVGQQQRVSQQSAAGTLEETAILTSGGWGIQTGRVEKGVLVENAAATEHSSTSLPPQSSGAKQRKVTATKLRHFAKNTSPSALQSLQPLHENKPESLIVSIPLALLRSSSPPPVAPAASTTSKLRKPTALCNFATKKRALSRSPSVSSDTDVISPPVTSNGSDMGAKTKTTSSVKSGKPRGRPRLNTATQHQAPSLEPHTGSKPCTSTNQTDCAELHNGGGMEGVVANERTPATMELPAYRTLGENLHVEDDQTSISSSTTTTSSTNSTVLRHKKSQRLIQRQARSNSDLHPTDSTFSLEALFSYYPPKLTVRDGELVPEQSLSIKNIDRSCLPSCHPIDNWKLGQPVRGRVVVTKTKRLKHTTKTHGQLAKV